MVPSVPIHPMAAAIIGGSSSSVYVAAVRRAGGHHDDGAGVSTIALPCRRPLALLNMDLDPRRLRFLLAVARYGGVLAAADELAVTASAVSQQVAKLERETGHTLLRRTSSGSLLTSAGHA